MRTIIIYRSSEANYTPESLLLSYAKTAPGHGFRSDRDGKIFLRIESSYYEYDHWDIEHTDKYTDCVTVYLKEAEKGDTK